MPGRSDSLYPLCVAGWRQSAGLGMGPFCAAPLSGAPGHLAYTFGLRHAVDADHIAAIDNVTRKLMQYGQRPVAVVFFFSLGHSTIVIIASFAIALATGAVRKPLRFVQSRRWCDRYIGLGVIPLFGSGSKPFHFTFGVSLLSRGSSRQRVRRRGS